MCDGLIAWALNQFVCVFLAPHRRLFILLPSRLFIFIFTFSRICHNTSHTVHPPRTHRSPTATATSASTSGPFCGKFGPRSGEVLISSWPPPPTTWVVVTKLFFCGGLISSVVTSSSPFSWAISLWYCCFCCFCSLLFACFAFCFFFIRHFWFYLLLFSIYYARV